MANTYEYITSTTLGSAQASVVISGIPQTFSDLVLKFMARTNFSGFTNDQMRIRFNGSSSSVYAYNYLRGDGSSPAAYSPGGTESSGYVALIDADNATANTFSNGEIYIPKYTSSTTKQNLHFTAMEHNDTSAFLTLTANLGTSTSAISSITFISNNGASFIAGSSFWLYGIKNS